VRGSVVRLALSGVVVSTLWCWRSRAALSSAVPPSRFFGYFQEIWGRHSVVPHRNRGLRLGVAGRGYSDTRNRFGWHVPRLRQRESSSHGQVPGLCIIVMMRILEFRRGLAPSALRRDHCEHGVVRKAADPDSASEVDLDARPCADRRQYCSANRQPIGSHRSAVQGCPRTLAGPETVARGI